MCFSDTLGQHVWGGFKEEVGVSKHNCYCEINDMQSLFREHLFLSRIKLSYEANCFQIEYAETETERSELQKNYVINKRSYLVNLRDFDTTRYYAYFAGGVSAIRITNSFIKLR